MYGLSTDVVRLTDEYEQRQLRSVAYYSGAHEALIVEQLRGTPLPVQATPFSRRFPWSHSQLSDITQHRQKEEETNEN